MTTLHYGNSVSDLSHGHQRGWYNNQTSEKVNLARYQRPIIPIHDPIPFASQIEFVDRAIENLAKAGKLYSYGVQSRQTINASHYDQRHTISQVKYAGVYGQQQQQQLLQHPIQHQHHHITDIHEQQRQQQHLRLKNHQQRVVSQPVHLPSMNLQDQQHQPQQLNYQQFNYNKSRTSPTLSDGVGSSMNSNSNSLPVPSNYNLPSSTSNWPPQRAVSGSVSGSRSISPKLKFDPFAPVSIGSELRPQSVSPEMTTGPGATIGRANTVSSGSNNSGLARSNTLNIFNTTGSGVPNDPVGSSTTSATSALGWSKVWGKPTGLTATSVWG